MLFVPLYLGAHASQGKHGKIRQLFAVRPEHAGKRGLAVAVLGVLGDVRAQLRVQQLLLRVDILRQGERADAAKGHGGPGAAEPADGARRGQRGHRVQDALRHRQE